MKNLIAILLVVAASQTSNAYTCSYFKGPPSNATLTFEGDNAVLNGAKLHCSDNPDFDNSTIEVFEGKTYFAFFICGQIGTPKKVTALIGDVLTKVKTFFSKVGDTYFKCL